MVVAAWCVLLSVAGMLRARSRLHWQRGDFSSSSGQCTACENTRETCSPLVRAWPIPLSPPRQPHPETTGQETTRHGHTPDNHCPTKAQRQPGSSEHRPTKSGSFSAATSHWRECAGKRKLMNHHTADVCPRASIDAGSLCGPVELQGLCQLCKNEARHCSAKPPAYAVGHVVQIYKCREQQRSRP